MQKEKNLSETQQLPIFLQISILSILTIIAILIGMSMVGKQEYNKQFCEGVLKDIDSTKGKAGLLTDKTTNEEKYACCRIPIGEKMFRKSTNCRYIDYYKKPRFAQKLSFFLKKFK